VSNAGYKAPYFSGACNKRQVQITHESINVPSGSNIIFGLKRLPLEQFEELPNPQKYLKTLHTTRI